MLKWTAMSVLGVATVAAIALAVPQSTTKRFIGRWDITVTAGNDTYPDWLEVVPTDGEILARVQPRSGSVHHVDVLGLDNGHLKLAISPATKKSAGVTWDVTVEGDKLTGVENRGSSTAVLSGVRAPDLQREAPAQWSTPEPIFNGRDLTGWEPMGAAKSNWTVEDGALVNTDHGANIRSTRKFDDFKLHIEFNCADGGNSGIYLRGRYEVQVEYEPVDANDQFHTIGSVYGMIAPSVNLPRTPGQWESFDVTLVGRNVTVVRDGTTTIDHVDIPGITGGALDADEGAPGPFYLQGDHHGRLQFRNITVSLPKR